MKIISKFAKILTLGIPNKQKRKASRVKTENFLHRLFNTEHFRCEQVYKEACTINKSIGFNKYHLVSLGCNCFGRMTFNYWGLKPRKADGEKTMPFDISAHPLPSVIDVLQNKFSDYFDNIEYSEKDNCWKNKKYSISFVHDHENDKDLFKDRYKNRIASFYDAVNDNLPAIFFCYSDKDVDANKINQLNDILRSLCSHKKYKLVYMIFNNPVPDGINPEIAIYHSDYPQGYIHMDINSKYRTSGLSFEKGVVDFTRNELLKMIDDG